MGKRWTMKVLIEPITKKEKYENVDGLILALKDFSVQSSNYYTLDEIKQIKNNNSNLEIFVNINKNFFNEEVDSLKKVLLEIEKIEVTGIFFYDLAVLQLKQQLNLKTDLVWSSTHMVNNYKTCNYYYKKGVKYALLGKEITLEEIKEIIELSKLTSMVEVVGLPSVAFSNRKLITNYYRDLEKESKNIIEIEEKITNDTYLLEEDKNGTSFYLKKIVNGTSIIKDLYKVGTKYIILRELGIDTKLFYDLVDDTRKYIKGNCLDDTYIEKYKVLGDFTNFFFKKTIYKVKKNG